MNIENPIVAPPRMKYLSIHSNYQNSILRIGKLLALLALIQLSFWLLPTLPEFKGIPYYLPLHTLMEVVSIIVSMMVFSVGWNTRSQNVSGNIALLACVSFSVALLDFFHTASYGGMPDFITPNDAQKHLNFWLSARLIESLILLVVSIRSWDATFSNIKRHITFASFLAATGLMCWAVIYHQSWLPDTFIPGQGLTPFKKNTEYFIIVIDLITAAIFWNKIRSPQPFNVELLFGAACVLAMSEFYFTLYTTMTGSYNVLGHVYKVIAYLMIYRAIVVDVIDAPYKLLGNLAEEQKTILESDIVGIVKLKDRKFVWTNAAFATMLGYKPEELMGKPTRIVYSSDESYSAFAKAAYQIIQTGSTYRTEIQYLNKDGSLRWYKISGKLINPNSEESIWAFLDITASKQVEQSLQESETRFRIMADSAPVLIWVAGLDKLCYWFNKGWLDFTGRTIEQEMGNGWAEGVHAEDFARCLDFYVSNFDQRKPFRMEYRLRHHSGEYRWIDDHGVPRFDSDGTFLGYIGSCVDITDRKNAALALFESEQRWRFALEGSAEGVWERNLVTNKIKVTKRFEEILGFNAGELGSEGDSWKNRLHPDDQVHTFKILQDYLDSKSPNYFNEYRMLCKDGNYKWILSRGMAVERDANGKPLKLIGTISDISERKYYEKTLHNENAKVNALLRNASDGIHILNLQGDVIEASDSFCRMLGYRRDEIIGMNVTQWDAQNEKDELPQFIRNQYEHHERAEFETVHQRKDGTKFKVEVSGYGFQIEGQPVMFYSSRDISDRKIMEAKLRTLSTAIQQSPVSVVITDLEANIEYVNPRFTEVTGYEAEEVIGQNPRILQSGQTPKETHLEMWDKVANGQMWHGELINKRKNGEIYYEDSHIAPVRNESGVITHFVATKVDITDRKAMEEQLKHLGHYDVLTDMPNRTLFFDRLKQALVAAKRDNNHLALLYIDLDKFKPINDEFGHHVGDQLLVEVAKRMQQCVRESDTVARQGGDEFVILLPKVETKQDAILVAEKIRHSLNQPFELIGRKMYISSSTGIVVYPEHGVDEETLTKNADIAMYQVKKDGRNAVILFDSDMAR